MSTATLLIVSARLRSIARAQRSFVPAPSVSLSGRSRVTKARTSHRPTILAALAATTAALLSPAAAPAQTEATRQSPDGTRADILVEARIGSPQTVKPCVSVAVIGQPSETGQTIDCTAERLDQAAKEAQAHAANAADLAIPTATSRDVVTGVANQTATRQRMGNAFGRSVYPQRPAAQVPPPIPPRHP